MADLVAHVWTFVTSMRTGEWKPLDDPRDVDVDDYEAASHALLDAWELRGHRGVRRCAHELSVHRWDAEDAVGDAAAIEARLAADGVEEFFEVFVAPPRWGGGKGNGECLRMTAVDADLDLVVRFEPEGVEYGLAANREATQLRGAASDLVLFLWGRVSAQVLESSGDQSPVLRLQSPRFR
jgi:hypothetical protein